MEPILLDFPDHIDTERLALRLVRVGDAVEINRACVESAPELAQWMPWARPTPTMENTETWVRNAAAKSILRTQLHWCIRLRGGGYLGTIGMHEINWTVPAVEIGYWLRTTVHGNGYMTEAVRAVTDFAFDILKVERVEIRTDDHNRRSYSVAERAGFQLEGVRRRDSRGADDALRDTRIYSRIKSQD